MLWHKAQGAGGTGNDIELTFNELTITSGELYFTGSGFSLAAYGYRRNEYGSIDQDSATFDLPFARVNIFASLYFSSTGGDPSPPYSNEDIQVEFANSADRDLFLSAITGILVNGTPYDVFDTDITDSTILRLTFYTGPFFTSNGQTVTLQFY
jgi:hypothetical protein